MVIGRIPFSQLFISNPSTPERHFVLPSGQAPQAAPTTYLRSYYDPPSAHCRIRVVFGWCVRVCGGASGVNTVLRKGHLTIGCEILLKAIHI